MKRLDNVFDSLEREHRIREHVREFAAILAKARGRKLVMSDSRAPAPLEIEVVILRRRCEVRATCGQDVLFETPMGKSVSPELFQRQLLGFVVQMLRKAIEGRILDLPH